MSEPWGYGKDNGNFFFKKNGRSISLKIKLNLTYTYAFNFVKTKLICIIHLSKYFRTKLLA